MRRHRVVAVDTVLGQQLPVGADRVLLPALDDRHARSAVAGDQVQDFLGAGQVIAERHHARVKADEAETRMAVEARRGHHVAQAALLVAGAVRLFAGLALELAVAAKDPAVIEALEHPAVALGFAADRGAAVWAGVHQRVQRSLRIAREQDVAARHGARQEVAGLGQFRLVTQVQPALVEHGFVFALHHAAVDEGPACDLKDALGLVGANQRAQLGFVRAADHGSGNGHGPCSLRLNVKVGSSDKTDHPVWKCCIV